MSDVVEIWEDQFENAKQKMYQFLELKGIPKEAMEGLAEYCFHQGIMAVVHHFNETKFEANGTILLTNAYIESEKRRNEKRGNV